VDLHRLQARVEALPTKSSADVAWFIDIDGVLNVLGSPDDWNDYKSLEVIAFAGLDWPIRWSPTLVRLMNMLHAKRQVSFRWLTTWEHDGPKIFAPAVGLDIGQWVAGANDTFTHNWWKLDVIVENLRDSEHLVIWTDDDIKRFRSAQRVVDFLHPDAALVVCPDRNKGLTPEEFNLILGAIEALVD
jgi:hypothetical protein